MADSTLVLVTGSAGRIGQAVVRELLARGRPVRGFDRVPTPGLEDLVVGSTTDAAAIRRAAEGAGAVVHLAATPDDDDFHTQLLPNNIVGVYEVLEAARLAGARRLVLASSGQVVWHQRLRGPWPIGPDVPPSPRHWYAAAKVFLEAAGRAYAEAYDMSVFVVRVGWVPRTPQHVRDLAADQHAQDVYLSPRDSGRFFACAVEAPRTVRFAVVYATSNPVRRVQYDLTNARQLLGYEPRDRYPEGLEEVTRNASE